MLPCVAMCCSVSQRFSCCCSSLIRTHNFLHCAAVSNVLQCIAVRCSTKLSKINHLPTSLSLSLSLSLLHTRTQPPIPSLSLSVSLTQTYTTRNFRALQCVAVSCNVLQCVAVCCSVLQSLTACCSADRTTSNR